MYSDLDKFWSGIVAISSGIVTMLLVFLNPQEKYISHYNSGNGFLALRNKTRVFLEIESKAMEIEMQMRVIKKLDSKRNDMNGYSLPIGEYGYKNAKKHTLQRHNATVSRYVIKYNKNPRKYQHIFNIFVTFHNFHETMPFSVPVSACKDRP